MATLHNFGAIKKIIYYVYDFFDQKMGNWWTRSVAPTTTKHAWFSRKNSRTCGKTKSMY